MIELSNLTKSYREHTVLHDINLFIQEGEIFGIIGRSGAGKSTLLRCMNRLENPDCGEIIIDQQNITHLNTRDLRIARHKTAMIFQHFNLLQSESVYDNIALPLRIQGIDESIIRQKIDALLPLVELENKIHAYPGALSGGQKQRVAIARALATDPKILLCDEATSALDPETTESILNLLKTINQIYGITIVLITHEMDVVKRICHRLAVMDEGRIVEIAALAQIFSQKTSVARALLYTQLSPKLPPALRETLTTIPSQRPLLRILFEGHAASTPFISQTSRDLQININIILATIDQFDGVTCGVLIAELSADQLLLTQFVHQAQTANLTVEILGYVTDNSL